MNTFKRKTARFLLPLILLAARASAKVQKMSLRAFSALSEKEQERLLRPEAELFSSLVYPFEQKGDIYRKLFYLLQERGIHITPNHFYSPIPDTNDLLSSDLWKQEKDLVGVDLNLETQMDLLRNVFPAFSQEYNLFPQKGDDSLPSHQFHFYNGMFDGIDALVLYCMVRHFKPRQVIEVGSGWSTRVTAQAALLNEHTSLTCIEPFPDPVLKAGFPGLDMLIPKKVQDVDLGLFQSLGEQDILFIDTSHVVKTGGDVNYIYLEVIPRLKKGVIVHIHDIFLPQEYPQWWLTHLLFFWNEQYLLQSFLTFNSRFRVLFANAYMRVNFLEEVKRTFPRCPFYDSGSSFWIQRVLD